MPPETTPTVTAARRTAPVPGTTVVLMSSAPAEALLPARVLMPGDLVQIAPDAPAARLTWLATPVDHRHLLLAGAEGVPFPLTLPVEAHYRLVEGRRHGVSVCLLCHTEVVVPFDLAVERLERSVICASCDAGVTARVLREHGPKPSPRRRGGSGGDVA